MIKNLIVNRSDLEALIRDYYECEEMKEFGQIERYGRLSFDEFMAECGCDFTTSTDNSYIPRKWKAEHLIVKNADRLPFYDDLSEMMERLNIDTIEQINL